MGAIHNNKISYQQVEESFECLHNSDQEDEEFKKNDKLLKDNYYALASMCIVEHKKKEEIAHRLQQIQHGLNMWKSGLEEELAL